MPTGNPGQQRRAMPGPRPKDAEGNTTPTELQLEFIDFLLDPSKTKGTQTAWAQANGLSQNTLSTWKKRDGIFRRALEKRVAELNVEPLRIQAVIEACYEKAIGGDVKAMTLYLQYVDKFTPKVDIGKSKASLDDLSDAELAEAVDNVVALRRTQ